MKRYLMAFRWRADDGPLIMVPWYRTSTKKTKQKKHCQSWTGPPLTKLSEFAHDDRVKYCILSFEQLRGRKEVILFEPQDNTRLYEAHIPEAMLYYNSSTRIFHRKELVDTTSMVMSPVDLHKPDFEVCSLEW